MFSRKSQEKLEAKGLGLQLLGPSSLYDVQNKKTINISTWSENYGYGGTICQVSTGYFLDGQLIACIERLVWVTPLLRIEYMLNTLESGKSTHEYHCITGIFSLIFFTYDDYIFHHIPSISTIQIVCRIILCHSESFLTTFWGPTVTPCHPAVVTWW